MNFKLNNNFLIIIISFLFIRCNGGQLKEVLHDSTVSSTTVIDTSKTRNADNEIKTITTDTLSGESRQFINVVANELSIEINMSNAAIQKSSSQEIKNLGKTIVDQQTELFNKLKNITVNKNVEIPATANQSMQDAVKVITSKSGEDFDEAYLNWVIENTKSTIQQFESAALSSIDQNLQQYAATSISILKQHLDAAKALKIKLP